MPTGLTTARHNLCNGGHVHVPHEQRSNLTEPTCCNPRAYLGIRHGLWVGPKVQLFSAMGSPASMGYQTTSLTALLPNFFKTLGEGPARE